MTRTSSRAPSTNCSAIEPITPFTARMTTEDVEYRDVIVPAKTVVMISTFAANRDAASYDEPFTFDVEPDRGKAKPMTFGAGIHNCLGASLARAELQEALWFLAPRMPNLELDGRARVRIRRRRIRARGADDPLRLSAWPSPAKAHAGR